MHPIRTIETQCSHAEFMQSLPTVLGKRPYEIVDNKVIMYDDGKRVEIVVNDLPLRTLGSLELPMEKVEFNFLDYTESQADTFMEDYRKHNVRCGGG